MRYLGFIVIVAALILCVFTLHSGISQAATYRIHHSKHDLSLGGGSGFRFRTYEVCVFCHAPHGTGTNVRVDTEVPAGTAPAPYSGSGQAMLLWNRALSNAASEGNGFQVYDRPNPDTLDVDNTQVRAMSLLCLSCHDGIGALNVLTKVPSDMTDTIGDGYPDPATGGSGYDQLGDMATGANNDEPIPSNIGGRVTFGPRAGEGIVHLEDDHPISFDYTTGLAGMEDPDPNTGTVGSNNLPLFYSPSTGQRTSMECSTCHDVHDQGSGGFGDYPFLTMPNDGSQMCLNCHNK